MKYFAKITSDYWALKNKAHESARETAKKMDSVLLQDENHLKEYKRILHKAIKNINELNTRSKNLHLEDWSPKKGEIILSISGNFIINIFPVLGDITKFK